MAKNYSARKVEYLTRNEKNKGEKKVDTNIIKAQEKLKKILGLKVNILNKKNNSGKVTIQYKNLGSIRFDFRFLTKH